MKKIATKNRRQQFSDGERTKTRRRQDEERAGMRLRLWGESLCPLLAWGQAGASLRKADAVGVFPQLVWRQGTGPAAAADAGTDQDCCRREQ